MNPVEADGCGLVVLHERHRLLGTRYEVIESGILSYDGECLLLYRHDGSHREVPQSEWADMLNVTAANKIPQCKDFDFFILNRDT